MDRPSNPFVFTKKTVFMQRLSDAVVHGAVRYIQGTVPVLKAGAFASKMTQRYDCDLTPVQASRKRKAGYATAKLYFWYPQKGSLDLHWILFITEGELKDGVGADEKWRDPTNHKERVTITNYVLVNIPTTFGLPRWSWRYTRASFDGLCYDIVNTIRNKHDERLKQLIYSLYRSPSFSGIREQVKKAATLIEAEWQRTRGSKENMPEIPKFKGYVRRLPDKGVRLAAIKVQLAKRETLATDDDMRRFYDNHDDYDEDDDENANEAK